MTNEEFVQLAQQNNAILTPEQTEQSRRETQEFFERYEVCRSWDGIYYVVDTKTPGYRFVHSVQNTIAFTGMAILGFLACLYIPAIVIFVIGLVVTAFANPTHSGSMFFFVLCAAFVAGIIQSMLKGKN
ncbi:MAG: hypothetical protein LBT05_14775 [Planctomycetaceae bacterium]|jgi:uncharacterized membrane protein|nr:hypothetical protein [Planctomycetaceae bacterium]